MVLNILSARKAEDGSGADPPLADGNAADGKTGHRTIKHRNKIDNETICNYENLTEQNKNFKEPEQTQKRNPGILKNNIGI